ncbi:MAG TPA: molecular chaperone DnaK, partial [Alphaproteobacteria bacterium]|nr:molecular chaperone DnaK [Alphaproteobacteria bacterium]
DNIPPAPRGMPQIEVPFDIDANGIVQVSAKDKATGKEQQIRIQPSGGLNEADIQRMVREAQEHAEDDKMRRDMAETRNRGDQAVHEIEKNLKEHGDKVPAGDKSAIESALVDLKDALKNDDVELIKRRTEAAFQASMKLGEAIYRAQSASSGEAGAGPDGGKPADENVVDADYEEVDENKKKGGTR